MNIQYNLFALFIISVPSIVAMEEEIVQKCEYNRQVFAHYFANSAASAEEKQLLGYDPQIRFVPMPDTDIHLRRLSLFVHGFCGDGDDVAYMQEHNTSDFITFHFPDHQVLHQLTSIKKTSFGGSTEILPLLYALKKIKDAGAHAVDIVPISRAATSTINTLATLVQPSDKLDKQLQKLLITSQDRAGILSMIQKGTISLWWPLRDIKTTLQEKVDTVIDSSFCSSWLTHSRICGALFSWIPRSSKALIGGCVTYSLLPIVTAHRPWAETVPKSLALLQEHDLKNFKIITLLQPYDLAVHNVNEGAYIESLPAQPEHNYVVPGISGGHITSDWNLDLAVNAFRKEYGSSYNPNIADKRMSKILDTTRTSQIIKEHGSVQQFLDAYYAFDTHADKQAFWRTNEKIIN